MTAQRYALHRCPGCGQWTPDERCSRCASAAPVPDLYAPHKPVVMPPATPKPLTTQRGAMLALLHAETPAVRKDARTVLKELGVPISRN